MIKSILSSCLIIILANIALAQKVSYQYPLHLFDYSDDITEVENHLEIVQNFDTTTISPEYQIELPPRYRRIFKDGKLTGSINLKDDISTDISYDKNGNIKSRTMDFGDKKSHLTYILDQEKLKLTGLKDGVIYEEVFFDKQNRPISRIYHRQGSNGTKYSKRIFKYDKSHLLFEEYYIDDKATFKIHYTYKNDKLYKAIQHNKESETYIEKTFTYFLQKQITEIVTHNKQTNSTSNDPTSQTNYKIEFFDEKGNRIKIYDLSYRGDVCQARITEFRLK